MKRSVATLAILTAVLVNACGSSAKTYYYTLQSSAISVAASRSNIDSIAITALSLPEIVDRSQLVLRSGDTQLLINDNHRWGQPLKSELTRNLAAHLAQETGVARILLPGQTGHDEAEYKITIDILRFDSVPGTAAIIEASWSVRRKGSPPQNGQTLLREAVNDVGYDTLVTAHGRALARLGRSIAEMIKP